MSRSRLRRRALAHGGRRQAAVLEPMRETMDYHKRAWRAREAAKELRSPEERAALFADALIWRERWRAEISGAAGGDRKENASRRPRKTSRPQAEALARFAAAIARAELKHFHWDSRREAEFQKVMKARQRRASRKDPERR
jgi:hypothetical protein